MVAVSYPETRRMRVRAHPFAFFQCSSVHLKHLADPILLDTSMTILCAQWDHVGSVLAIAGCQRMGPGDKEINVVQFYNPFGEV